MKESSKRKKTALTALKSVVAKSQGEKLKKKLDASAVREQSIAVETVKKNKDKNKPIPFDKMTPEQQRKQLFGTFPGDTMGIVVGKNDPNDPYRALMPDEES